MQAGGGGEGRGGQETYGLVMSGGRCEILQRHVKKNPTGSCLLLLLPLSLLPSLTACLSCFHAHGLTHRLSRKKWFSSLSSSLSLTRARSLLSVCLSVCVFALFMRVSSFSVASLSQLRQRPDSGSRPHSAAKEFHVFQKKRTNATASERASERARMDPLATYSS